MALPLNKLKSLLPKDALCQGHSGSTEDENVETLQTDGRMTGEVIRKPHLSFHLR